MPRSRRRPDFFARRAQREGHAARSIYKLEELDRRWQLLRRGQWVLDLGCSPGSWMQYAAVRVGSQGRVLGYDLKEVHASLPAWAEARVGDVNTLTDELGERRFDIVLSDMAPATMGDHKTDAARSAHLALAALAVADHVLKTGGHVVVKLLEGEDVAFVANQLRQGYARLARLRPKATRSASTEIFLAGLERRFVPNQLSEPSENA